MNKGFSLAVVSMMFLVGTPVWAEDAPSQDPLTPVVEDAASDEAGTETEPETKTEAEKSPAWDFAYASPQGFVLLSRDEKFKLRIGGYLQAQLSGQLVESGSDMNGFSVPFARILLTGHVFDPNVVYTLLYDFSPNSLKVASIKYAGIKAFQPFGGEFVVPFNLEGFQSSAAQQFVQRSIIHNFFGVAGLFEIGAGVYGILANDRVEYWMTAVNGEGPNTLNLNNEFRYVGRLVYNVAGHFGSTMLNDVAHSEEPQVSVAAAAMFNDTPNVTGLFEQQVTTLTTELNAKYKGFGGHAAFFFQHLNPDIGPTSDDYGVLVQGGYFVVPKKIELALRYGHIFGDLFADQCEYTLAFNWFIYGGHKVKLQLDYSALRTMDGVALGNDRVDHRGRAQVQVAF